MAHTYLADIRLYGFLYIDIDHCYNQLCNAVIRGDHELIVELKRMVNREPMNRTKCSWKTLWRRKPIHYSLEDHCMALCVLEGSGRPELINFVAQKLADYQPTSPHQICEHLRNMYLPSRGDSSGKWETLPLKYHE